MTLGTPSYRVPWIKSPVFDGTFILLPSLFAVVFTIIANSFHWFNHEIPLWAWLVLVVFIDVSHVWSSLFRTYLNKYSVNEFKKELILIPICTFIISFIIYGTVPFYFWRLLAYFAVFHFVKQQIGFFRIYARNDDKSTFLYRYEMLLIISSMLVPIIYWHLTPRSFNWFLNNDFFQIRMSSTNIISTIMNIYYTMLCLYFVTVIFTFIKTKRINIPKSLLILFTAASWYVGIVLYNNDLSFSVTNIVSHGIPYIALIWFSSLSGDYTSSIKPIQKVFYSKTTRILFFVISLFFLAYLEEFFWDIFVWQEHSKVFFNFMSLDISHSLKTMAVAVLITPQVTHYILDGYIWSRNRKVDEFKF